LSVLVIILLLVIITVIIFIKCIVIDVLCPCDVLTLATESVLVR